MHAQAMAAQMAAQMAGPPMHASQMVPGGHMGGHVEQSLFDLRHRRYKPNERVESCVALNAEIRYATSEELNTLDLPTMAVIWGPRCRP